MAETIKFPRHVSFRDAQAGEARALEHASSPSYEVRRNASRGVLSADWLEARFSFSFGTYRNPARMGFGALRVLNEDWIQPGTGFGMHPHRDLEILLIPLSGAVAHADSLGNEAVVRRDEVMLMRAGSGIEHSQLNASDREVDHHLQVWLSPRSLGLKPGVALGRFDPAQSVGSWQLIASEDGRDSSLVVDQDVRVFRARLLSTGELAYRPAPGRSAYLHVVRGDMKMRTMTEPGEELLRTGDAIAWTYATAFSIVGEGALGQELLLFDLPRVLGQTASYRSALADGPSASLT